VSQPASFSNTLGERLSISENRCEAYASDAQVKNRPHNPDVIQVLASSVSPRAFEISEKLLLLLRGTSENQTCVSREYGVVVTTGRKYVIVGVGLAGIIWVGWDGEGKRGRLGTLPLSSPLSGAPHA
jgi:hypothetical protein